MRGTTPEIGVALLRHTSTNKQCPLPTYSSTGPCKHVDDVGRYKTLVGIRILWIQRAEGKGDFNRNNQ